jgi:hypothetical protein
MNQSNANSGRDFAPFALVAFLLMAFAGAAPAEPNSLQIAQAGPQKPFSQMSQAEQQALAQKLSAKANSECSSYRQAASGGSMRATYEAAACTYGVFYLGVPADYPNRSLYKQQFFQNSQQAKALGSNAPFLAPGQ